MIGFQQLPQQNSTSGTTVDVSASFGRRDVRWVLTGYIRDLTDGIAAAATQFAGPSGDQISTNYAPRRTYGVRANMRSEALE